MLPTVLLLCQLGVAATTTVTGTVYRDANANGKLDTGERGMPGVAVSNQDTVVLTDRDGRYRMTAGRSGLVFVSIPDGSRAVGAFWRKATSGAPVDFGLAPTPRVRAFTFVHASDTHIAPPVAARTARLRDIVDSLRPAFTLITGDLVRDALRVGEAEASGYYQQFADAAMRFRRPVFTVPGNHEIFGIERSKSGVDVAHPLYGRAMYRRFRGPDYYSFTHGGVHFVALNSVDIADQWYYGHVDSTQLAWLARDLAVLPAEMPVVTFQHIPFFSTMEGMRGYSPDGVAPTLITINGVQQFRHTVSNAQAVLAVLRARRHVLALAGHIHATERLTYLIDGQQTRFEQVAAVVGPTDAAGLRFPSGLMHYTVRKGLIGQGRFIPLGM
jgi:hypothetical protein